MVMKDRMLAGSLPPFLKEELKQALKEEKLGISEWMQFMAYSWLKERAVKAKNALIGTKTRIKTLSRLWRRCMQLHTPSA